MAGGFAVILDTCALLWLANGDRKLSRAAIQRINEAPAIYVSAISGFEIALKAAKGGLRLPLPAEEWCQKVITQHHLTLLPLDLSICIVAAELPPIHNDPCDRFIIATAKKHGFPVVTADERFSAYGVAVLL